MGQENIVPKRHGQIPMRYSTIPAAQQGLVPVLGPHATDTVSDDLWRKIATVADEEDLPIHSHLAQALDEVEWSWETHDLSPLGRMQKLGLTDLKVNKLWVHALYVGDEELNLLNPAFDRLGHCPSAQMQFGFPAHTTLGEIEALTCCWERIPPLATTPSMFKAELRFFSAADSYAVTMGETLRSSEKTRL